MIYDVFTLGSTTNYITFNDDTDPDYYLRAQKRFVSDREIRQFDSVVPDEMGIVDYQTLVGRSYFVIEAKVYPISGETALYGAMEKIRKVCNPKISQDDADSDTGYVLLKYTEGGDSKQLRVKPIKVDIPETIKGSHTPVVKIWCKVRYPFIEAQTANSVTLTPVVAAGTGIQIPSTGLLIPTGGVSIGADTGGASQSIINGGDYKAYPVITFQSTIVNPKLTNTTTGKYVEFTYNVNTGTVTVTMDYDGVTATHSDGTNMLGYLTAGSDLEGFCIEPGANALTLTASTLGSGATCTVSCRDTWPLS
jgi:hypothetical protein